jgi:hypothetical protein
MLSSSLVRIRALGSFALLGALLSACSISTTDDSITFKGKTKFIDSAPTTRTATKAWAGEPIEIENANGDVEVIGEPGRTTIEVSAKTFVFANKEDAEQARAVQQGVRDSLAIVENGTNFYVKCAKGTTNGSADGNLSGCEDFVVRVPAGTEAAGLALKATAQNGDLRVSGLTAATGQQLQVIAKNGDVVAAAIVGGVKVESGNGDVSASVRPTRGSLVEVRTENGDATLGLPANFAADRVALEASGRVDTSAFSDVQNGSGRGAAGTGAASIAVIARNGDAVLRAQ